MMMSILIVILFILTINFLFLNHPLSFGLIMLIQTLMIALITGMMNYNFWFSYILFLIMVGGMLILFIYMTNVASNEKFKFSSKLFIMSVFLMSMIMIPVMFIDKTVSVMYNKSYEMTNQNIIYENSFSLSKFLNFNMNINLMLIIIYLLITLIMVVKLTSINNGPLRQKF
uniref:NADH-ubiquinone oxidoreductase chain 6 n=1 Tax=Geoffmonteithia queenslanda TaxID=2546578 RepID=A0A6H0N472_9CUCU|nr:NADH dehydrogenase subunit 6 [Geoffmonteithia queenslanda]QNJ33301.1 NADH dehydrogenase subunit 6 [Geoffmonteithia queenslanda]